MVGKSFEEIAYRGMYFAKRLAETDHGIQNGAVCSTIILYHNGTSLSPNTDPNKLIRFGQSMPIGEGFLLQHDEQGETTACDSFAKMKINTLMAAAGESLSPASIKAENGFAPYAGAVKVTATLDGKPFGDIYICVSGGTEQEDLSCAMKGACLIENMLNMATEFGDLTWQLQVAIKAPNYPSDFPRAQEMNAAIEDVIDDMGMVIYEGAVKPQQ